MFYLKPIFGGADIGDLAGETIDVPVLLEAKEGLNGVQSTIFNNIDYGDSEGLLIKFNILLTCPNTNAKGVYLIFNDDVTVNHYGYTMRYEDFNAQLGITSNWITQKLYLAVAGWGGVTRLKGQCEIDLTKSIFRDIQSNYSDLKDLAGWSHRSNKGIWTNIVDDITKIEIKTDATSFSGDISLFKIVNIAVPDE